MTAAENKRADNPRLRANGLSALRLCVWLFDNFRIELFYIYQSFLFTLRAIKRKYSSTVSARSLILVLFLQIGQSNHSILHMFMQFSFVRTD